VEASTAGTCCAAVADRKEIRDLGLTSRFLTRSIQRGPRGLHDDLSACSDAIVARSEPLSVDRERLKRRTEVRCVNRLRN